MEIRSFFNNIGNITVYKNHSLYKISNKSDIHDFNRALPFFNRYNLVGEKLDNFNNFNKGR